jgi:Flp pilus assembly protein TadD
MWLPASSERYIASSVLGACLVAALGWLAGCSSTPARKEPAPAPPTQAAAPPAATAPATATSPADAGKPGTAPAESLTPADSLGTPAARPEVPPAARADFDRAVSYMRAGNDGQAELGFKQMALQYPQFAAPLVNVAILQRKTGQLEQAEDTLKSAVSREGGNAVAWTELGATQRMRGEFTKAAASYEQAIAVDPRYAPAWRNLGVLEDLYLEDPNRALKAFEQYKQLTGEEKPVSGWIAELRQRLGIKRPAASDSAAPGAPGEATPQPNAAPPDAPSQGTPQSTPQGGQTPGAQPQEGKPSDSAPSQSASGN